MRCECPILQGINENSNLTDSTFKAVKKLRYEKKQAIPLPF
jgi:hypothetical protein